MPVNRNDEYRAENAAGRPGVRYCERGSAGVYASSGLLSLRGVRHGFSARAGCPEGLGGNFDPLREGCDARIGLENITRFARCCGFSDTDGGAYTRQVHGARVRTVTMADRRAHDAARGEECDGLVTAEAGLPLYIFTADCAPVLMCDPDAGVIAAVHCGWRSTAADILGNAVAAMEALGASAGNIRAAVGPAIGGCCFETGDDVASAFTGLLGEGAAAALIRPGERPGKFMIDLPGTVSARLAQLGVPAGRIDLCRDCTKDRGADLLWSARWCAERGVPRGSSVSAIELLPGGFPDEGKEGERA